MTTQISHADSVEKLTISLEELLVKQFRALQSLIDATHKERDILTKGDSSILLPVVEDKEAILDQISVLEDSTHMVIQEISKNYSLDPNETKLSDILSKLAKKSAERIRRLSNGILTLSEEVRDLNLGNQALALSSLEWLDNTLSYILDATSPSNDTYDASGNKAKTHLHLKDIDQAA